MNKDSQLKTGSILAFCLAVSGIVYLVLNNKIITENIIGIIIQLAMVGLMIWSRITFGARSFHATANATEGRLVTNGPYAYLRHPIYASIIYFTWAGVFSYLSLPVIIAALCVSIGLIIRMLLEENFLNRTYSDYKSYSEKTFRLIPFIF